MLTKRKICAVSLYLPPSLKAIELAAAVQSLVDCVDQVITKHSDAIIFVGGDFNSIDISHFCTAHPNLLPIKAGATRIGRNLDEVYTNFASSIHEKLIQKPLAKVNGVESDHSVVAASFKLPKHKKPVSSSFKFRPLTSEGVEKFRKKICSVNWEIIRKGRSSKSAESLDCILQSFVSECFPEKTRSVKSTDTPWMNAKSKRFLNKKRRVYKKEGKSQKFIDLSKLCETVINDAKKVFLDKVIEKSEKARNTKHYYKSVNMLKLKELSVEVQVQVQVQVQFISDNVQHANTACLTRIARRVTHTNSHIINQVYYKQL